jgi:ubiquinone/menaquinone biosynthesis C-methylase UbiE
VTDGALFGQAAWDYDRTRRQLVPGFDRFYGAILESIPFREEQEIRVLDLGAGTGLLSAVVAGKFPRARVTLVDLSVEMLRVARRRLAGEQGRFEFRTMDYARKPLPRTEGGYDLVVSALSVHHLTHGDKRESCMRESTIHSPQAAISSTRIKSPARRPRRRRSTGNGGCGGCARQGSRMKIWPPRSRA